MDLFDIQEKQNDGPLAARMRPRNLDEYIGQDHIVGKGRLLRRAIAADQLTSVIFYGPPGTGKTTLARVIANHTKSNFITLNAVLAGVQAIRDAIATADQQRKIYDKRTILFVDEVHRWNKSQQDALLPWVENGTIILVGATTENPFFEVNKALVSRSRVFQLKPLTKDDLFNVAKMTLADKERGYGRWNVEFEDGALEHLIDTANGDARSLLNALELAVETTPERWSPNSEPCFPPIGTKIYINKETCEESIQKKVVLYDRDGDYHYDIISAFIKSLRGRDPDAALYWMARMITAGEDPHFIFRRMLISACEDTGLADPNALTVVQSCAAAFDRIGLPEGQYMLTQAALYLSTAPKSNSSMAYFDALKAVREEDAEVPNHLRDGNRDSEGFAHGAGYMYPHAYKDHWVAQQYLPDGLNGRVFYNPTNQGYENTIRNEVLSRRELQITSLLENENPIFPMGDWWEAEHLKNGSIKTGENLTFSPGQKQRDAWQKRTDSNRAEVLLSIRNKITELADIHRHDRCLVLGADDGLVLWDLWRKTPEGFVSGVCKTEQGKKILVQYSKTLQELEKPLIVSTTAGTTFGESEIQFVEDCAIQALKDYEFDKVFYRDNIARSAEIKNFAKRVKQLFESELLTEKSAVYIAQKIPSEGQKLSEILKNQFNAGNYEAFWKTEEQKAQKQALIEKMALAEDIFYSKKNDLDGVKEFFDWNTEDFCAGFLSEGFSVSFTTENFVEERNIGETEIEKWFNCSSSYGGFLKSNLGENDFNNLYELVKSLCLNKSFAWKHAICFLLLHKDKKTDICGQSLVMQ